MRREIGLLTIAVAIVWAQSGWREFSLGPMTKVGGRYGRDGIRGEGVPLKKVVSRAFGVPENRILGPAWIKEQRYALTAIVSNPDDFQPLMQQELNARFQFLSHRELRAIPVYVLKPLTGSGSPKPATERPPAGLGGIRLNNATVTAFASELADYIQRPVYDESGIQGSFEISLWWKNGDAASLKAAVKDQLGCDLSEEIRNVDLLVIDHIERPQFN